MVRCAVPGPLGTDHECIYSRDICSHRQFPTSHYKPSARTGVLTRLFIRNLEPPYRLRFKVLSPLAPRRLDFKSAWVAFEQSQAQLAKTIQFAIGLAVDEVRVESPVYARFSYNVYGALRMLAAHERRHLWQIEQILKAHAAAQVRNFS